MKTTTLRQQKALETKNRLIDSALRVFSRKGFDSSTTKDIAKEAGVTDGLIYHYFASKEELLWAVVDKHSLNKNLQTAALELNGDDSLESLMTCYFNRMLDMLHEKESLIVMFFGEAQRNPQIRERLVSIIEEGIHPLYFLLNNKGVRKGDDVLLAIRNVQTTIVMYFLLFDRMDNDKDGRDRYIEVTVRQFLRSLG
ncbi:putative HTH-type transcriptional regulator TtgW [compost metagenome]